ncbi:MAG TPA: antibiotic biosynthesis monooxygenase family protein [Chloroflexota bacterium]|jgi:heme-degrading monooxygenase HmoA
MIVRMIHVQVPEGERETAHQMWKEHCAPLMISSPGCLSEELLACREAPGEMISISTWESDTEIDAYRDSEAHHDIQMRTRELLKGAQATVKTYEAVA